MNYELSAIISPGLEGQVLSEFKTKLPLYFDSEVKVNSIQETGAVTFYFNDINLFHLVKILRSPTKFTLKITTFKCRDFPKLFNKLSSINWKNYLYSTNVTTSSTSRKSRMIHTERINQTATRAINKWLDGNPRKKLPLTDFTREQKILITLDNDNVTVKVDCSGAPNYKRNLRATKAIAPLRENYAYILLKYAVKKSSLPIESLKIIDPMCGSGTFLSELLEMDKLNSKRDYSYEYFYFLRNIPRITNTKAACEKKINFTGIEKNNFLKEVHEQNFKGIHGIKFIYEDFFATKISTFNKQNSFVICNLPYGKRIKTQESIITFYEKFIKKVEGFNSFILLPTEYAKRLNLSSKLIFSNGGISVSFCQVDSRLNANP